MKAPANGLPQQQALDWLFARLGGASDDALRAEASPGEAQDEAEIGPTPEVRSPEDLRLAAEWLRRERQRLAAYTRSQIAWVQQEHQALLQQKYLSEQGLILRAQEVARKEEMVLAQGRTLQQQAEDISRREQGLAGQLQQWWQANEELAALEEANQTMRQDAASHRTVLEALQAETMSLQIAREQVRADLEGLLAATESFRQTRDKEEAALSARQAQLEQRIHEAEQAVLAADQRQAELDDLESRLRIEFEEQERDLRHHRRVLADYEGRLREERFGRGADPDERGACEGWTLAKSAERQRCSTVRPTVQLTQGR